MSFFAQQIRALAGRVRRGSTRGGPLPPTPCQVDHGERGGRNYPATTPFFGPHFFGLLAVSDDLEELHLRCKSAQISAASALQAR